MTVKFDSPAAVPATGPSPSRMSRRSMLTRGTLAGEAAMLPAGARGAARGEAANGHKLSKGDAEILRFLAAAEILETDLWQQYNELAQNNTAFQNALNSLDADMAAYVAQNTADEAGHADFLNAFLVSMREQPVNLDRFRTLAGSMATGAAQVGRLTNLLHLNVDTSGYRRYRSTGNPDFGDAFAQVVNIVNRPGIPPQDGLTDTQMQAIANTAAFHFAMIEQGGSSLYDTMSVRVADRTVLRTVTSIGETEVAHRCKFISASLPLCSVIRPTLLQLNGAQAVVSFLTRTGLFFGQSQAFLKTVMDLAKAADQLSG